MALVVSPEEALRKAILAAGGTTELGRRLGIKPQSIDTWRQCPPGRVIAVEKACNGAVTRHDLRPDIYPLEDTQQSGAAA